MAGILQPFLLVWRSVTLRMIGWDTTVIASSFVRTMNWGRSPLAIEVGALEEAHWQPRLAWHVVGHAAGWGVRRGCC